MNSGKQMTFSVKVYPSNTTCTWFLDGTCLGATGKSYIYTAIAGKHSLMVRVNHGSSTNTQTWNIYGNSPPITNAGDDQTVDIDATVTLDGSGSNDPDENIVSYKWEQTGGPAVTLTNANTSIAQFTASFAVGTVLTFELTVTDAGGLTSMDTCKLFIGVFNKTYGGISIDGANAVQQTVDGGYILGGNTDGDAWLIKTDADGNKVWDKTFGGSDIDYANAGQQTSDGGYILAGYTLSYGAGAGDAWLIKTDADGNKVWDKTFGGIFNDGANAVQQTVDGGYILAGETQSYGTGIYDAWLIKTNADGNAPETPTQ
jgi:hypothetical protein